MPATKPPSSAFAVSRVGVRFHHDPAFTIDRPKGSGDYAFVHFLTPVWLLRGEVRELQPAETCILFAPTTPHWFSGVDRPLSANWFHFRLVGPGAALVRLGIPIAAPITGRSFPFVEPLLRDMERELGRREPGCEQAIHHLAALCLLRVARADRQPLAGPGPQVRRRLEMIHAVRLKVRERPHQRWTLAGMASLARLSPSRFSALYRGCFGSSPIDDVIAARIDHARGLLTNTSLAVAEVARQSGFDNNFHFSRLFRRRVGCAPRDYYRLFIADPARAR